MISNLKKAARDRDTVTIGGGEFGPDEFRLAAHMLDCYPELLEALAPLLGALEADCMDDKSNVYRSMMISARAALTKAQQHPARGFV